MSHRTDSAPGQRSWPVTLSAGALTLRPPRLRDGRRWSEIRLRNQEWLEQWEPSSPTSWQARNSVGSWRPMFAAFRRAGRMGHAAPFMVLYGGELAGQITVSNIVYGALKSCTIGYWIDRRWAGRGLMPTSLALVIDYCFGPLGLHRVEVDIRPENIASLRVVEKLGLRQEGYYERFLDIGGQWCDHLAYAVTAEELAGELMLSRVPMQPTRATGRA